MKEARERLYRIWHGMWTRCTNPAAKSYQWYGARGVYVTEEWRDFGTFFAWALRRGYASDLTLDRVDNDGPYAPENCRWVTRRQNLFNRFEKPLTAFGETKQMIEWVEDPRCVVSMKTLWKRITTHGWDHERAISTPVRRDACSRGHRFTKANTGWYTDARAKKGRSRYCRKCKVDTNAAAYQRRKVN